MYKSEYDLKDNFKVAKNESINLETFLHSKRVSIYTKKLAQSMNYSSKQINHLILAALNHDIGKSRIPEDILNKKGKLTKAEYEIIKMHAKYGSDILQQYNFSQTFCDIIEFHHENFDGSGYYGLKGNDIPIASRIIHVVDVYDAITSNRCYRKAYSKEDALLIMESEKHMYDPKIWDAFKRIVERDLEKHSMYLNTHLAL